MTSNGMKRWLQALSGRPRAPALPTADFYFLGALADLVSETATAGDMRPIRRLGPHTFATDSACVIIRYATEDELARIEARRWGRVFYVIDDMLPIAASCAELPAAYREKLERFSAQILPRILALSPTIVAPSPAIRALFPDHTSVHLDPCALEIASSFDHFARPAPFRLAFLGTRSHGAGIEFLLPVLESVAAGRLPVTLTLFFGKHLPPRLKALAGIDNRAALDWPQYRRFLSRERFHAVLAPLPDTPFNAGRSITKLLDVAAVGACGLYSDRPPFAGVVEDGVNGLLLPDHSDDWSAAIVRLGSDLAEARRLAAAGAALAARLGERARVRRFWLDRLGIG